MSDLKRVWQQLKLITGKVRVTPDIPLEDWYQHFSRLFNSERYDNDDDNFPDDVTEDNKDDIQKLLFNSPITKEEVIKSIKYINVNKATGGNLYPQHLIYGISFLLPVIVRLFNRVFTTGEFPEQWTQMIIIPIDKKSSMNNADNYRRIALIVILSNSNVLNVC